MPLFDPDTNMLFLAGKGDTTIMYMEVTEKDPYLVEGIRHSGEQTKGVCLVPKRALNVMQAEVNRLLQLTSNMVIPIMYQVPRKVSDIFLTFLVTLNYLKYVNVILCLAHTSMSLNVNKNEFLIWISILFGKLISMPINNDH